MTADYHSKVLPQGRWCEPDEVAKTALFLLSDDASFVSGARLFVDNCFLVCVKRPVTQTTAETPLFVPLDETVQRVSLRLALHFDSDIIHGGRAMSPSAPASGAVVGRSQPCPALQCVAAGRRHGCRCIRRANDRSFREWRGTKAPAARSNGLLLLTFRELCPVAGGRGPSRCSSRSDAHILVVQEREHPAGAHAQLERSGGGALQERCGPHRRRARTNRRRGCVSPQPGSLPVRVCARRAARSCAPAAVLPRSKLTLLAAVAKTAD